MPLDPRAKRFLDMIAAAAGQSGSVGIEERRHAFRTLMRQAGPPRAAIASRDFFVRGAEGPLAARLYGVAGHELQPGLLFFHGGGFVSGDLDTHDALCGILAETGRCRVVSVAYRLAPEHPFPVAFEDAWAATVAVARTATEIGIDPARLAVGGDSVGAALAALVAQKARRENGPALAAQVLICPVLDAGTTGASREAFATGYFLDLVTMAGDLALCGLDETDAGDPRVSPLRAPDLFGLPPAIIHTAEFDPVRDDGEIYAARLAEAGVSVRLRRHPGMIHLFYGLGRLIPQGTVALKDIAAELAELLA